MPALPEKHRALRTVTTINGRRVPKTQARVSVFDNALLYADGIFETFLAIEDQVVFLQEHLDRLYKGAEVVKLTLPVASKTLAGWMVKTIKAHPDRIKKLRLTITSGESARWVGKPGKPQVILSASPHEIPVEPFHLLVSDLLVDHRSVFRSIKTISYGLNAAAFKGARMEGYDDALLLNTLGNVAEITSANIFWVKRGIIYTPSLTSSCLGGVTRQFAINQARQLGYRLVETEKKLSTLLSADEIFLSSSLKLVLPITEICRAGTSTRFVPGEITLALAEHVRKLVLSGA
jgi:branched-chain amino acid aminotransferase